MGRVRKRHAQTELNLKFDKHGQRRGRSNKRAGRKPSGPRAGVSHRTRKPVDRRHPQHVTLRVVRDIGWLRQLDMYAAVRRALRASAKHVHEFRIVHISVQNTHIHLLCEASDRETLSRRMQGFEISAAKHLNAAFSRRRRLPIRRRGKVFADRYHDEALGNAMQVRNAINYVVNNWRRHEVDHGAVYTLGNGRLDPYASGLLFAGWRAWLVANPFSLPDGYELPLVTKPETWLLRIGWSKVKPIEMFDVPGPRRRAVANR